MYQSVAKLHRAKTAYGEHEISERDEDEEHYVGYCEMKTVGIRFSKGIVTKGELVYLVREPRNLNDRNVVAVINVHGEQVGHVRETKLTR